MDQPIDRHISGDVETPGGKKVVNGAMAVESRGGEWSDWYDLMDPLPSLPPEPILILLRGTKDHTPVRIEYPQTIDSSGVLYIKGLNNGAEDVAELKKAIVLNDTSHPAVDAYLEQGMDKICPKDGLQFKYALASSFPK